MVYLAEGYSALSPPQKEGYYALHESPPAPDVS